MRRCIRTENRIKPDNNWEMYLWEAISIPETMLAGERIPINTGTFSNDMTTFQCRGDVLTLLVHLGYLGYHWPDKTVFIPNKEIAQEYINAISMMDWHEVIDSSQSGYSQSASLLAHNRVAASQLIRSGLYHS